MAIEIIKFARPKLWLSLVAGGTLTVGQTYYFFGFIIRGGGYYGASYSQASEQMSITPTTGNQSINIEWYEDGGSIISFADAGGGVVTVTTSVAHGRANGDSAYIRGTTNYDATYTISNVTSTTFDITATWVATETGSWFADAGYDSYASGIIFKWDKYTMIDAGDGKPYQWLNLNDPANSAKSEFDDQEGHRRWTRQRYNTNHTGTNLTFTREESTTASDLNGVLYDGLAIGSTRYGGSTRCLTDIAWRESLYPLDSKLARDKGSLAVIITGVDNTIRTLIDALYASGYDDMFSIADNLGTWNFGKAITIFGSVFSAGATTEFKDAFINCIGGQFLYSVYSSGSTTMTRCTIFNNNMCSSSWGNPEGIYNDSIYSHSGNALILDNCSGVGFVPKCYSGSMTYYAKIFSDVKLIGGYGSQFFQWRYQRSNDTSAMTDVYIQDLYIYLVENGSVDATGHLTRVEFANNGVQNFDVDVLWNYQDADADKVMECLDVTCDRPDGKIKVYTSTVGSYTWTDTWNMKFGINFTILDKAGEAIEGAKVKLFWDVGSDTDTSDSSGEGTVTGLSYTLTHGSADGAGYYTASAYKKLTLEISKAGYKPHKIENFEMTSGMDWSITLKKLYIEDFNINKS